MRSPVALRVVLAGTPDSGRGLLHWKPALWSALAGVLTAVVSAVMGLHILAAFFIWTSAPFVLIAVIGIAATIGRLKVSSDA